MELQMTQAVINTIGVFLTMIGAVLIAVDVTRQYKGFTYEDIVQQDLDSGDDGIIMHPEYTKEFLQWQSTNRRLMRWGLICVLLGGFFQIWSSWLFKLAAC